MFAHVARRAIGGLARRALDLRDGRLGGLLRLARQALHFGAGGLSGALQLLAGVTCGTLRGGAVFVATALPRTAWR